jgi:hypothetical protein
MLRISAGLIVIVIAAAAVTAQQPQPTLVLAELFTSEGCSSCPPADHLLETLITEQPIKNVYVVALSEHVTYWDHQGWKDPFGSPQYTTRQQWYGRAFNLDSIYTPQLVIDGTAEFVGSDERRIRKALTDAALKPKPPMTVEAIWKDGELRMKASGPGVEAGGAEGSDLWWALTEDNLVVEVKRGENASRTLRHSGVVRLLRSQEVVKPVKESAITLPLKMELPRHNLRVVAFMQSKKTRKVISVGWTEVIGA